MDILNELDNVISGKLSYSAQEVESLISRAKQQAEDARSHGGSMLGRLVAEKLPLLSSATVVKEVPATGGYNVAGVAKRFFGGSGE